MSKSTVLVVEDDVSLREALGDTLELAGYQVKTAADAVSTMTAMNDKGVGYFVLDTTTQDQGRIRPAIAGRSRERGTPPRSPGGAG